MNPRVAVKTTLTTKRGPDPKRVPHFFLRLHFQWDGNSCLPRLAPKSFHLKRILQHRSSNS